MYAKLCNYAKLYNYHSTDFKTAHLTCNTNQLISSKSTTVNTCIIQILYITFYTPNIEQPNKTFFGGTCTSNLIFVKSIFQYSLKIDDNLFVISFNIFSVTLRLCLCYCFLSNISGTIISWKTLNDLVFISWTNSMSERILSI